MSETRHGGALRGLRRAAYQALAGFVLAGSAGSAPAATPPGTVIENVAFAAFRDGARPDTALATSNVVRVTTVAPPAPSELRFLRFLPGDPGAEPLPLPVTLFSESGRDNGPFREIPYPDGSATPGALASYPLAPTSVYRAGEVAYLRLVDTDGDRNPHAPDRIVVRVAVSPTGDEELLLLGETGPATGVFAGYVGTDRESAARRDGRLSVSLDAMISATYVDPADETDTARSDARVDPAGLAFDSRTGTPLAGVRITLMDAQTGAPAVVFGDDTRAGYPRTVVTGAAAVDGAGGVYEADPGSFRFPHVPPGYYRLRVEAPDGYRYPSTVSPVSLST